MLTYRLTHISHPLSLALYHTHIHTHTHAHTHTHTTHTPTHTLAPTQLAHTHTRTRIQTHAHTLPRFSPSGFCFLAPLYFLLSFFLTTLSRPAVWGLTPLWSALSE